MDSQRPLMGIKVVVTRARDQAGDLSNRLENLGAEIIEFPTIEIRPPEMPLEVGPLDDFDWAIFTSINAVALFASGLERIGRSIDEIKGARICAVGPATRRGLLACGLHVDLMPSDFVSESILAALSSAEENLRGKRIFLPRGNRARPVLSDELRKRGAEVAEIVVYDTIMPADSGKKSDALVAMKPDLITFTSSSTAQHFIEMMGSQRIEKLKESTVFASIGPITTQTTHELGLHVQIEPAQHDIPGLVDAIAAWFGN